MGRIYMGFAAGFLVAAAAGGVFGGVKEEAPKTASISALKWVTSALNKPANGAKVRWPKTAVKKDLNQDGAEDFLVVGTSDKEAGVVVAAVFARKGKPAAAKLFSVSKEQTCLEDLGKVHIDTINTDTGDMSDQEILDYWKRVGMEGCDIKNLSQECERKTAVKMDLTVEAFRALRAGGKEATISAGLYVGECDHFWLEFKKGAFAFEVSRL